MARKLPPLLHSSSGRRPSAYHPFPLHRRCKTLTPLRLCVQKNPPTCSTIYVATRLFFNTDGTDFSELPSGTPRYYGSSLCDGRMERKPASRFSLTTLSQCGNMIASNKYSASAFSTIHWLSHYLSAIPHNPLALHKLSVIHHDLSAFHHFLAFPEGDKLLIGHGWPEWRPKGDMTCLPCLSSRRMDELCRSSTGVYIQQRFAPTIFIKC